MKKSAGYQDIKIIGDGCSSEFICNVYMLEVKTKSCSHRLIEDLASKQDMSEVAATTPPDKLQPCGEVGCVQEASDARGRHQDLQRHSRQDVKEDARLLGKDGVSTCDEG